MRATPTQEGKGPAGAFGADSSSLCCPRSRSALGCHYPSSPADSSPTHSPTLSAPPTRQGDDGESGLSLSLRFRPEQRSAPARIVH